MIPKIIHFCWFGKGEKNNVIHKCISSWKEKCSDYEIIEWNEDNVKLDNIYVRQAFEHEKWAFVSDYIRLLVLYKYGGIYVDTDLEITKNIDGFLNCGAFFSYESTNKISTALIGCEKGNKFIKKLLDFYGNKEFIKEDGTLDMKTNVAIISDMIKHECKVNLSENKITIFQDDIIIYPKEYFCMLDLLNKENNYAIHHFQGSWKDVEWLKIYRSYYLIFNEMISDSYNGNQRLKKWVKKGYNKIGIYGFGSIGKMFLKNVIEIELMPKVIIDNNYKETNYSNIPIDNVGNINNYDIDLLIITPITEIDNVKKQINISKCECVSIIELYGMVDC